MDEDEARYFAWLRIASFEGRGSGIGFWLFLGAAWGSYCYFAERGFVGLGVVAGLISLIPAPASAVRRLHDVGLSGAWLALALIPVVGWATLARLLTAPGTPGPNRFGPRPLSVAELKAAEEAEREAKREEKRRAESGDSSDGCVGTVGDSGSDDDRETEREEAETAADAENGDDDTLGSGFGDGFWSFFSSFGGGDGDSDGGWLDFFDGDCGDGGDGGDGGDCD